MNIETETTSSVPGIKNGELIIKPTGISEFDIMLHGGLPSGAAVLLAGSSGAGKTVLANGEMGAPEGPDGVAWFKFGPHPGEIGSAVIDGHYGWKDSLPAVFDRLKELKTGDKLTIEDDKGLIATFIVREIRGYDPKADATDVFVSKDGKSHLNLVTCDGPWNRNTASRPNRIVVFTDKD